MHWPSVSCFCFVQMTACISYRIKKSPVHSVFPSPLVGLGEPRRREGRLGCRGVAGTAAKHRGHTSGVPAHVKGSIQFRISQWFGQFLLEKNGPENNVVWDALPAHPLPTSPSPPPPSRVRGQNTVFLGRDRNNLETVRTIDQPRSPSIPRPPLQSPPARQTARAGGRRATRFACRRC